MSERDEWGAFLEGLRMPAGARALAFVDRERASRPALPLPITEVDGDASSLALSWHQTGRFLQIDVPCHGHARAFWVMDGVHGSTDMDLDAPGEVAALLDVLGAT